MNTDVLSHIFETIVDANPFSLSIIRAVSREWFETARNTPKLWSNIILNRRIHFADVDYVALHLQYSGGIPLTITVTLPEGLSYDAEMPAIGQLRTAVHKIKSLTIDVPFFEAWQTLVSHIGEGQPAPLLERLVLKVKGDVNDDTNGVPFTALSAALTPSPNLVYLQIPAWPLPVPPPPHLASVTTLIFETPFDPLDILAHYELIRATPQLQHLTFKVNDYAIFSHPQFKNPISIPHLRSAHVTAAGHVAEILSNLHAPLLTDLYLHGGCCDTPEPDDEADQQRPDDTGADVIYGEEDRTCIVTWATPQVLTRLSAQSPLIRRLELHYVLFEYPIPAFSIILDGKAFPALEELVLTMTNIPDAALIKNAVEPSSLRLLKLSFCRLVSMEGLGKFVRGRSNAEFMLSVKGSPAIGRKDIESLSELVHVVKY